MAVKYRATYDNESGDLYQLDFGDLTFEGSLTAITGDAIIGLTSQEDMSSPLRSRYLKVSVLSTPATTFEDLLDVNEREISVTLYRNGNVIFFGYLSSEGAKRNWVAEESYINFDVLDPLAFLDSLAFVDSLDVAFTGKYTLAEIIANALIKSFEDPSEEFNIKDFTFLDYAARDPAFTSIFYTTGRFLKEVTVGTDHWTDEDSGESAGCADVLIQVLKALQLVVSQINGTTWFLRNYLHGAAVVTAPYINSYDSEGADISEIALTIPPVVTMVVDNPDKDPGDILHVEEDQDYYYRRGVQKLATDFEYKYLSNLIKNPNFIGGVNGVSMPDWDVSGDYVEPRDDGKMRIYLYDSGTFPDSFAAETVSNIIVGGGQTLVLRGRFHANFANPILNYNVRYTVGGTVYKLRYSAPTESNGLTRPLSWNSEYFSNLGVWGDEDVDTEFEIILPETFAAGYMEVEFYAALNGGAPLGASPTRYIELLEIKMSGDNASVTGVTRVSTRDDIKSLLSKKDSISVGTSDGAVLSNQLFTEALEYPLAAVKDRAAEDDSYNSLVGCFNLNHMSSRSKRKIFSGSFRGYVDPDSFIYIPEISDNTFAVIDLEFDSKRNVGRFQLEERILEDGTTTSNELLIYKAQIEPKIV